MNLYGYILQLPVLENRISSMSLYSLFQELKGKEVLSEFVDNSLV